VAVKEISAAKTDVKSGNAAETDVRDVVREDVKLFYRMFAKMFVKMSVTETHRARRELFPA